LTWHWNDGKVCRILFYKYTRLPKTSNGKDHFLKATKKNIKKILNEHSVWVLSLGKVGKLADVKNWKLDKTDLKMANLPFAKLHFVSLRGANLSGSNFRQADLLKGSLIDADLDGADLEGANLSEGDLSFSKCMGANFADANLEGANFEGAKLSGANFGGANLDKANFEKTDLRGLNIASTNLLEADDEGTKLSDSIRNEKKPPKKRNKKQTSGKTAPGKKPTVKSSKEDLAVDSNAVNPDLLEKAVADLVEKVKSDIQLDQVKAICKNQLGIEKIDKVECTNGDIVTHKDQVAFKLDFKISYNLSLLVDRKGDFIKKDDSKV
jgi:uncharacterized protein YjbI with pentapeptide repeats